MRVPRNKIEKLLDVFPRLVFSSGIDRKPRDIPGAALVYLSFTPKDVNSQGVSKELQNIQSKYENTVMEIAASLQLSRNICIALFSLQSWKPFMQKWMRARIMLLDAQASSAVVDRSSKAANDILKSLKRIAEETIPRAAENIALAIGALCLVLPSSAHAVKIAGMNFLLNWLSGYEHEYRQWSAAISLGVMSRCLHVTDHKQKTESIKVLLEVITVSKSTLVKGACGAGLGMLCQDLFMGIGLEDTSPLEKDASKTQEAVLLRKIVKTLSDIICQFSDSSKNVLRSLYATLPGGPVNFYLGISVELLDNNPDDLEEDIWGIAGLVFGLGISINAIYRAGCHDAVRNLKGVIISWIPQIYQSLRGSGVRTRELMLSAGSCLVIPILVDFCQRVELIDDAELDYLVICFKELISELLSVKVSNNVHQNLMMAACVGAGALLSSTSNRGLYSLRIEHVKDLLDLFRKCYSNPHPPLIHLAGMLGFVNALGAGAGTLVQNFRSTTSHNVNEQKQACAFVSGPLMSNTILEAEMTSMIQEIFLVAQNYDDHELQHYAAWTISFLRHGFSYRDFVHQENAAQDDTTGLMSVSDDISDDSMVTKLSLWLMHLNYPGVETDSISHVNTIANALRCLSQAPRLPQLDWGAIIRRCMRYEDRVPSCLSADSALNRGTVREECLLFSLSHANEFDPLLIFLDELCDLSRFTTLELNLQSFLLLHLVNLAKVFSDARQNKLFDDMADFLTWLVSCKHYSLEEKSLLRASFWKGLYMCMNEFLLGTQDLMIKLENCMKVLFSFLPGLRTASVVRSDDQYLVDEWSEAVICLSKAQEKWLLDLLQVSELNFTEDPETLKKVQVKARLVRMGSIPFSELGKLKAYILNSMSKVVWDVLVEVAVALQNAEANVRRQWLVDAVEISCVTSYPSTALRFVGLVSGSCCKYMPFLIVDEVNVLNDLPVTLTSLLLDPSWEVIAETVASHVWTSTLRICDWATQITSGDYSPTTQPINDTENSNAEFLLEILYHTCTQLKHYLSPDKQLRLANMRVLPKH